MINPESPQPHIKVHKKKIIIVLFDLILYVTLTIFQLNRDGSSWVEPVLSWDKCVLPKDHNAVTPVRLEPVAPRSRVKHSTTEPLRSLKKKYFYFSTKTYVVDAQKNRLGVTVLLSNQNICLN